MYIEMTAFLAKFQSSDFFKKVLKKCKLEESKKIQSKRKFLACAAWGIFALKVKIQNQVLNGSVLLKDSCKR